MGRPVPLYLTPNRLGPATCGIVRPCVVLPQELVDSLSSAELRLILLHELIHIRRRDVLVDKIASLVAIIHWFHPVAWLTRYFLRRERELACDAAVLERATTAAAADYGHTLLKAAQSLTRPAPQYGLVGMFSSGTLSLLERRIRLILS